MEHQLLEYWNKIDPLINVALAINLASLTFAGAAFLTTWVNARKDEKRNANGDALTVAAYRAREAEAAVRSLLIAFAAFTFLLAASFLVDPLAGIAAEWNASSILDGISASGGLGVGVFMLLNAALHVYRSLGDAG